MSTENKTKEIYVRVVGLTEEFFYITCCFMHLYDVVLIFVHECPV